MIIELPDFTAVATKDDLAAAEARIISEVSTLIGAGKPNYSEKEAAELLGTTVGSLQKLRRDGRIGYVPVAGHYRYLLRHIESFFEENAKEPSPVRRSKGR